MRTPEQRLAYTAWLYVCIFWGVGFLAYRVGVRGAPPFLFAGLRILAAGLVVSGWALWRRTPIPSRREWVTLAAVGILTEGICNAALAWSAQRLSSGMLGVMVATIPFWMVGVEAALPGGERLRRQAVLGLALGFGGLVWLAAPEARLQTSTATVTALIVMQGACLCWAVGSVIAKRAVLRAGVVTSAGLQMLFAGGAITLLGLALGEGGRMHFDAGSLAAFAYLLVFGSIIGFGAYIYALQKLPISIVALHRFINPVVALALGWAVLGERMSSAQGMAVGVIFVGVWLVQRAGVKEQSVR